jgi:guanine deaminase
MKKSSTTNLKFMRMAIRSAMIGIKKAEGGPFGACLVKKGKIIALAHNEVLKRKGATCHAEINAIRIASQKLKSYDLSGCVIYSTTEPCPMCFSAIHWASIDQVLYGTSINDVQRRGFNELSIPSRFMKKTGKSKVKITAGFGRKECGRLLKAWDALPLKETY